MRNLMLLMLLTTGCDPDDGATNDAGSGDQCPEAVPTHGDACSYNRPGAPNCYYYDECTSDPMGKVASCHDGKWEVGANLIARGCPQTPPANGAACPCGFVGRQVSPCDYQCGGGTVRATCIGATLRWSTTGTIDSSCMRTDGGIP